ncbi:MAG: AlpA family phage regulatory protein [Burkholderiaceae bacterium]|nr:AlpA family phage regulatory protein [Burkholderiaceae bacterium]
MHLAAETRPQVKRDRLIRLADVEALTGLKKSSVYLLMKRGDLPQCVQVTARCVAWPESAILQWVQDRIAASQQRGENKTMLPASSPMVPDRIASSQQRGGVQ